MDSRRVLVGIPGTIPQAHVFWLGPLAPYHRRTCFGWGPRHHTTDARVLVGGPGTIPQTHVFWLGPRHQGCRYPIAKHISNPDFGYIVLWKMGRAVL